MTNKAFKKLSGEEQKLYVIGQSMENLGKFFYIDDVQSFWTDTPSGQCLHALVCVRQKPLNEITSLEDENFQGMKISRGE